MQDSVMSLLMLMLLISVGAVNAFMRPPCSTISNEGTTYTLTSHVSFNKFNYPNNMSCTWSVPEPSRHSTWEVRFNEIDLETSPSTKLCRYDNLTVTYQSKERQMMKTLCGKHYGLTLLTNSSFTLNFQSDISISFRGFKITWKELKASEAALPMARTSPIFESDDIVGSCGSLMLPVIETSKFGVRTNLSQVSMSSNRGTYLHGADCFWNIVPPNGSAVYVNFTKIVLEGSEPCRLDNLSVFYRLPERNQTQRRVFCNNPSPIKLISQSPVTILLLTDSNSGTELTFEWFVAPCCSSLVPGQFDISPIFKQAAQCSQIETTTTGGRISMYNDYPLTYSARTRCEWPVNIPQGMMASFSFEKFQLARSYFRPWQRYNYTHNRCSYRDDSVRIFRNFDSYINQDFCAASNVKEGKTVLIATQGRILVTFNSEVGGGQGFILKYNLFSESLTGLPNCPPLKTLDTYRRMVANLSDDEPTKVFNKTMCSWDLTPQNGHFLSVTITLDPKNLIRRPVWSSQGPECYPKVLVSSESKVEPGVLFGNQTRPLDFFKEFCPRMTDVIIGLFDGPVNVDIRRNYLTNSINLDGVAIQAVNIPKPTIPACADVKTSKIYRQASLVHVFTFSSKPGCITGVRLIDSPAIKSKGTFELSCTTPSEDLEVFTSSFVNSVKCGSTMSINDTWKTPMILKFPPRTSSKLKLIINYNFPVLQSYCQMLNGRTIFNGMMGFIQLPLVASPTDLPQFATNQLDPLSCSYELPYREGFSISLKISHNLAYDEIDYFCHLKLLDMRLSPHFTLTVTERDRSLNTWTERQLDICVGDSVGSLATKSEMVVDGSLQIDLIVLRESLINAVNFSSFGSIRRWQFLSRVQPQKPEFKIIFQYVPYCPELACRSESGSKIACPIANMSTVQLEAPLLPSGSRECELTVPTSDEMRRALITPSSTWLAKLEVSNFSIKCPCHDCNVKNQPEYISVSFSALDTQGSGLEELILCGNFTNNVRVLLIPIKQDDPKIEINYRVVKAGATIRISYIDCQLNQQQSHCSTVLAENLQMQNYHMSGFQRDQSVTHTASNSGLILSIVLLAAVLIGCLLLINREFLMARGSRIQEGLRRMRAPTYAEDTLHLNPEVSEAQ